MKLDTFLKSGLIAGITLGAAFEVLMAFMTGDGRLGILFCSEFFFAMTTALFF